MFRASRSFAAVVLALCGCTRAEAPAPGPVAAAPTSPAVTPPPVTPTQVTTPPVVRPAPPELALAWVRANSCADGGPMSLTASDGTGLRLAALDAKAVVEGPLAFTELRLAFDNPHARVLEGRFSIQLPPGAALSRFAMAIDGRWQEGEVVERQAARVAYEDFLHRRQDPALLESGAGNRFDARVFPIPAGARKEIVIAWSQALAQAREPYVLPVCGLPALDALDVEVLVRAPDDGAQAVLHRAELHEKNYSPRMDLELRTGSKTPPILRAGDLAVARLSPAIDTPPAPIEALTILFDTSASRALDFTGQVERLAALVGELGRRTPGAKLRVVAFDQQAATIYDGTMAGFGAAETAALTARGALGASDFGVALASLVDGARVLYVGDGVFTAGPQGRAEAIERLRSVAATRGITRFDALVDGGLQDRPLLEDLSRGELELDGIVIDARVSVGQLADKLERPTRSSVPVTVEGASWWWPRQIDGVQSGDTVLVYAELPADRALQVQIGDVAIAEEGNAVATAPRPLLARAQAQAKIEQLGGELAALGADAGMAAKQRLRGEIIALSTRHRVLSEYTALLVLESEADYHRFGIERTALADVLTVGERGIEVLPRGQAPLVAVEKNVEKKKDKGGADDGRFDDALAQEQRPVEPAAELERDVAGADEGARGSAAESPREAPPPSSPPVAPGTAPMADPAPIEAPPRIGGRGDHRAATRRTETEPHSPVPDDSRGTPQLADPYDGELAAVMRELAAGRVREATELAAKWRARAPGDVLALVALGEAYEAAGDRRSAARAYGSLIDLFPSRTDLRRMAGERLERLGDEGLALAIDTYAQAVAQRPDHPSSHRLYAYALLKASRHEEAFAAILAGLDREYPGGRFAEVQRILREDLGLIAAAWLHADPTREPTIARAVGEHHTSIDHRASVRFVLNWETDANDVDLHVFDAKGNHAFFRSRALATGGELYADVTTGYGPECFAIVGQPGAGPYRVQAHYYARGPMGYGMGKLQVITHDGAGGLAFGEHPFVLMKDNAWVDLATVTPGGVAK